jgi:hypothetical protein
MTQPTGARRPLPALAFLVGLLLLTALVWWRVIHRGGGNHATAATTATATTCSSAAPSPTVVPPAGAVNVQVLNSTDRSGLASSVGQTLTQDGFKSAGTPANDLTTRAPVAGVAEIRFGPAGKDAATLLSYYVPNATLVADTRTTAVVDLALGAKFTALAAPADVTKALSEAHVVQSGGAAPSPTAHPTC